MKAVVDAYDGEVTFYRMPIEDPLVDAWQSAFSDLFTALDDMPDDLRDHLRYPKIFRVQTNMWARYQVSDPESLISVRSGGMSLKPRPRFGWRPTETTVDEDGFRHSRGTDRPVLHPDEPGRGSAELGDPSQLRAVRRNDDRRELEAFMVGETRSDGTSRLVSYEITSPMHRVRCWWRRQSLRTRRSPANFRC